MTLRQAQDGAARPFKVLGIQQIAIGAPDKTRLQKLWVDMLGLEVTGTFRSERENVDEDICVIGSGPFKVEVDLMQPLDIDKKPAVHTTPLNHVGLWIDDLPTAVDWLTTQGVRFAPGGIRKGAAGFDICFMHPKANDEFPIAGEGVLIEMVQAPPEVIKAFEKYKILTEAELHARYEISLETYNKTINIEAQLMVLMAIRYILPAALEYQTHVGQSVAAAKAGGVASKEGKKHLTHLVKLVDAFKVQADKLESAAAHNGGSSEKHAKYMRDTLVPAMAKLRDLGDQLELIVPHETWPLPTYREMLFVK